MQVSSTSFSRALKSTTPSPTGCWQKSSSSFGALFATKAKDYKLRPNEEMAERLVKQLTQPNFEQNIQELSIGCGQLPWMIRFTALFGQFHLSSFTRSLFYHLQETLTQVNQEDKAKRLFIKLQINRKYYAVKEGRKYYTTHKTMTSQQYHADSQRDETSRPKGAWVLYDKSTNFLSTLNLRKRQWFQPFLITIGFVPETIQSLDPK